MSPNTNDDRTPTQRLAHTVSLLITSLQTGEQFMDAIELQALSELCQEHGLENYAAALLRMAASASE